MSSRLVLGLLFVAACGGGDGSSGSPDAAPVPVADAAPVSFDAAPVPDAAAPVPDAAPLPDAPPPNVTDYLTRDVSSLVTLAGTWAPNDVPEAGLVDFWGVVRLGSGQLEGVALTGWAFHGGFGGNQPDVDPIRTALLAQEADGRLRVVTAELLPSLETNGAGSVLAADFNGDSKDDIFLAAHNESPFIGKASTAYLSRPDGKFDKLTLGDKVMAHHASLALEGGKPIVLAMSFEQTLSGPVYRWNGSGFTVTNDLSTVGAMAVAAADLDGDGDNEVVLGDNTFGPGEPFHETFLTRAYRYENKVLLGPPTALPAPFFNKPAYAAYVSEWDPSSKTHTSRLWIDDLNHDGKLDIICGQEIWSSSAGLQKSMLQLLVNQGAGGFVDRTTALGAYSEDTHSLDYSLRLVDVDASGIDTLFLAASRFCTGTGPCADHGNYIIVNDGSGKMHVAMHDEFTNLARGVAKALPPSYPGPTYFYNPDGHTPRFVAYRTAAGKLDFLAVSSGAGEMVNGKWVSRFALANLPLEIDLATMYREPLTVADRNGSHRIRTFAGDDTIADTGRAGACSIDGGAGTDTVTYAGARGGYTIGGTAGGVTITDGAGNVDTLKNVERARFSDGTVDL